jgi:N-methylhydantoinase A
VIVPAMPGALSAFGILVSDVVKDYSRTVVWRTSAGDWLARAQREFSRMRSGAARDFRQERWAGKMEFAETLDVRYHGQGYELNVPFGRNGLAAFHAEHERRYGYSHEKRDVEIVTLRLRARIAARQEKWGLEPSAIDVGTSRGRTWLPGKFQTVPIVARDSMKLNRKLRGPAVVTEYSATTWVPPRARFHVDSAANLIVEL